MKVAVVGATGTLGPHAVRALIARGHQVLGVTTMQTKQPTLEALGADSAVADLLDEATISAVLERARPEAVVNLATRIPAKGPMRTSHMRATNRLRGEGTRNLLAAARKAEVRRYVSESMIFIYGFGQHAEPVEESQEAGHGQTAGLRCRPRPSAGPASPPGSGPDRAT
jgi:nucleoside-diphosphate-sugar epimerase